MSLNVSYSVRSNLRSSHRSEGMDDIFVPDRVLEIKNLISHLWDNQKHRQKQLLHAHLLTDSQGY